MAPAVTVIGAATSAGSHHAGQEHAPAALRAAGFVDRLADAGLDVADLGDVVTSAFTPDAVTATARSLPEVVRVAGVVADAVAAAWPLAASRSCSGATARSAWASWPVCCGSIPRPACCTSTGTPTWPPPRPAPAGCWTRWARRTCWG